MYPLTPYWSAVKMPKFCYGARLPGNFSLLMVTVRAEFEGTTYVLLNEQVIVSLVVPS
jgi:hypothetical protein